MLLVNSEQLYIRPNHQAQSPVVRITAALGPAYQRGREWAAAPGREGNGLRKHYSIWKSFFLMMFEYIWCSTVVHHCISKWCNSINKTELGRPTMQRSVTAISMSSFFLVMAKSWLVNLPDSRSANLSLKHGPSNPKARKASLERAMIFPCALAKLNFVSCSPTFCWDFCRGFCCKLLFHPVLQVLCKLKWESRVCKQHCKGL